MILVKIIGKIALLPLIFLISMACFTINVTTKIACHFAVFNSAKEYIKYNQIRYVDQVCFLKKLMYMNEKMHLLH